MAGITLASAQAELDFWIIEARKLKSFTHEGRAASRHSLAEIQKWIEFWERRVQSLSRGGAPSSRRLVLTDV